jgi:hypothetical protein
VKLTNGIILAALVSVVAACGAEQTKQEETVAQDQGVNVASEADEQTAGNLPSVIVARVPLDADGNELVDQGEAREVFGLGNAELTDGTAADAAFGQGASVSVADELDADSSTQSTYRRSYYWNTPWYPGKLLGRGLWWGRNPYVSYNNYSYGYSYRSSYSYNNCRYYTYYPSYRSSYGYGYGNGGGYGYGNGGGYGYGNSGYGRGY